MGGEQLTSRQKTWFASVQASLKRDIGKTVGPWVSPDQMDAGIAAMLEQARENS